MKKRRKKKQSIVNWPFVLISAAVLSAAAIITMAGHLSFPSWVPTWTQVGDKLDELKEEYNIPSNDKTLRVHFINVNRGESVLLEYGGKNALIDSGSADSADKVISYLNGRGVVSLDLVVVSTPTPDRIGAMNRVVDIYDVDRIVMPKTSDESAILSQEYTDMLLSINRKGIKIQFMEAGDSVKLGTLKLFAVAPTGEFSSIENSSLVLKAEHGDDSFLFTGDMQNQSQKATLQRGFDVSADVIKVANYGSEEAFSEEFIEKVSPKIAVVSPKKDASADYADRTIAALEGIGAAVYRTDTCGDVVIVSDGRELDVKTEKDGQNG